MLTKTKSFSIPKQLVMQAYKLVKSNAGAAGVDKQSLEDFERNLKDNLYKIWNRMSSGTYFPPPVKAVSIPKKQGGERILGIPTVSDRIAQMTVKLVFEQAVEPHFHPDSYGYRPNKSALDAVGVTRQRCWRYDWVIEYDIKGLFDNIDHELLMKAVRKHTDVKWIILYIERWLKAPMRLPDGTLVERTKGTPQGGVISPVLSNLFLHYVFDAWMKRNHPNVPWCRYADDGVVHCRKEQEALALLEVLAARFEACRLELHPTKTKIVYCKDGRRKGSYHNTSFDFLGFSFRPRVVRSQKLNCMFVGFTPSVSERSLKSIQKKIKWLKWRKQTELTLEEIADQLNPILRGCINYYGKYNPSGLYPLWRHVNKILVAWAKRKYKKLDSKTKSARFLMRISENQPHLFAHWKTGARGAFA